MAALEEARRGAVHLDAYAWQDRIMSRELHLVGDPEADRLLSENPFALLVGMLLDQRLR